MSTTDFALYLTDSQLQALKQTDLTKLSEDEALALCEALEAKERQRDIDRIATGFKVDLVSFFRAPWSILEPELPICWSWHYDFLAEWLTMVASGEFKKRYPSKLGIIINVPPRTAKSTLCTVVFPVWTWLEHPERRFLCASYSGDLAVDHAGKRRFLVKSKFFQEYFADRFT